MYSNNLDPLQPTDTQLLSLHLCHSVVLVVFTWEGALWVYSPCGGVEGNNGANAFYDMEEPPVIILRTHL